MLSNSCVQRSWRTSTWEIAGSVKMKLNEQMYPRSGKLFKKDLV
ncbi:MAG: hypothetical protein ACI957_000655, partial [Verrucomicrobiales bacterium]